jgi:ubiquinone/menaquinone biosynthesis C-methylase UbiE
MYLTRRAPLILGFVAAAVVAAAQQRDPEEYAHFLENADRVARMHVPHVVEALGVRAGQSVADIGSGSGLFSRAFARAVGSAGTVYAVDIDKDLLAIVMRRAQAEHITNIEPVQATADDAKIPRPVDLVFICDTLHHISNRAAYLAALRKSLAPGGRIAIIDFSRDWPSGHEAMRYTEQDLDGWMKAAGYARTASFDFIDDNFFVVYQ